MLHEINKVAMRFVSMKNPSLLLSFSHTRWDAEAFNRVTISQGNFVEGLNPSYKYLLKYLCDVHDPTYDIVPRNTTFGIPEFFVRTLK